MLVAVVEKVAFGIPAIVLYALGRLSGQLLAAGLIDLTLGAFFIAAYRRTAATLTTS
jgi:hypothetical protein